MKRRLFAILLLLFVLLSGCAGRAAVTAEQGSTAAPVGSEAAPAPVGDERPAAPADKTAAGTKTPVIDEASGKTVLTLAGIRLQDYGWDALAAQFNAQSADYTVQLRDYFTGELVEPGSVPGEDEMARYRADLQDAKTRLHTELIAGNVPDMLVFDALSPLPYLGKQLLLDLDPYLAADADISPEDVLGWDALHEYGGLYVLARQFVVETLMCSQAFYDAHSGWTVADYLEIERGLRDDQQMIYYMSPEEFLTQMGGGYLARALDLEAGTCDFDNAEFIGILNGALACGQYEALDYAGRPVSWRLEAGELMCCATWLDAPSSVTFDRVQGGKTLAYIGWPTADGSCGSVLQLYGDVGAFAATASPEGCWEFIKYALKNGADAVYYGSPVYAPLMREQVALRNESAGQYTAATEEDVQAYIAAVQACRAMGYRDESVMEILQTECAPMLRGEATPEQTAKNIQARVSLYMAEQYG